MPNHLTILWLRRDLRLDDHAGLCHALTLPGPVQPVFVFDTDILARFADPTDRRLTFLAETFRALDAQLRGRGGGLLALHGRAEKVIPRLAEALHAETVVTAADFEPATIARDKEVAAHAPLVRVKDHLIFAPKEVLKDDGTPFKVFTPYARAWHARATPVDFAPYAIHDQNRYADIASIRRRAQSAGLRVLDPAHPAALLGQIGYTHTALPDWPADGAHAQLAHFLRDKAAAYPQARDRMGEPGTSRLSPYLRFGLLSAREAFRSATETNIAQTWTKELIWREFYAMVLYHWPESATTEWNPAYRERLNWSRNRAHFDAWREGRTGYPVVDAAMRQLLATGWMHNRARMIVASFLTKHLRIDWRLGEEHFAQYLMDYELASNVGGWQWAASTGTDAQPYFRVFNPILQSQKFDPRGEYIRAYVPELRALNDKAIHEPWKHGGCPGYPAPIVDHGAARAAALAMFKA